jgi:hypothetical protein
MGEAWTGPDAAFKFYPLPIPASVHRGRGKLSPVVETKEIIISVPSLPARAGDLRAVGGGRRPRRRTLRAGLPIGRRPPSSTRWTRTSKTSSPQYLACEKIS